MARSRMPPTKSRTSRLIFASSAWSLIRWSASFQTQRRSRVGVRVLRNGAGDPAGLGVGLEEGYIQIEIDPFGLADDGTLRGAGVGAPIARTPFGGGRRSP